MSGKMSRSKGQRGERELAALLMGWSAEIGVIIELKRNLQQTQDGGYDLNGLEWLAIEVKRHETLAVGSWWSQTCGQAKEGQIPFLAWRKNNTKWQFRTIVKSYHLKQGPTGTVGVTLPLVCDLSVDEARKWFLQELRWRCAAC